MKLLITPFITLVFVLQFSRASFGTISIFYMVYFLLNGRLFNKKTVRRIIVGLMAVVIIILLLPNSLIEDFIERLLHSSTEISPNTKEVWTRNDVYRNWRGYEIYLVMQEFYSGNLIQKLIGYGFGHRVLLGAGITLLVLTSIPVFHNGYIQVISKSGVIGLSFLFIFYFNILKYCYKSMKTDSEIINSFSKLVFSLTCGVIFFSYFKSGIFRGTSIIEFFLLLGFLINRINKYKVSTTLDSSVN